MWRNMCRNSNVETFATPRFTTRDVTDQGSRGASLVCKCVPLRMPETKTGRQKVHNSFRNQGYSSHLSICYVEDVSPDAQWHLWRHWLHCLARDWGRY